MINMNNFNELYQFYELFTWETGIEKNSTSFIKNSLGYVIINLVHLEEAGDEVCFPFKYLKISDWKLTKMFSRLVGIKTVS